MAMRYVIPPMGVTSRLRATLLSSALPIPPELVVDTRPNGSKVERWMNGITFQSLGCDPLTRIESVLCGDLEEKELNELGEHISFDSFTIYDGKRGAAICTDIERIDGDIIIRFPAMVSEQLANELMEGGSRDFDPTEPNVNPSLASSASLVAGGPYNPNDALALLEQAAADFLHGAEATLHITPRGMSHLNFFDQGSVAGERWFTAQGNLLIADAGYSGAEPLANSTGETPPEVEADEWWYASGPVGWVLTQPTPIGEPWQRFDYARNQFENLYEGFAMVLFDPCGVVAVPVCYDPGCMTVEGS